MKLENAALRAENQLLKRYLEYFENLFAKKSGVKTSSTEEDAAPAVAQISRATCENSNNVDLESAIYANRIISVPVKRDHKGNAP